MTTILVFIVIWCAIGFFFTLLGNKIFDNRLTITVGDLLCSLTGIAMVIIFLAALIVKATENKTFDPNYVIFDIANLFKHK